MFVNLSLFSGLVAGAFYAQTVYKALAPLAHIANVLN